MIFTPRETKDFCNWITNTFSNADAWVWHKDNKWIETKINHENVTQNITVINNAWHLPDHVVTLNNTKIELGWWYKHKMKKFYNTITNTVIKAENVVKDLEQKVRNIEAANNMKKLLTSTKK